MEKEEIFSREGQGKHTHTRISVRLQSHIQKKKLWGRGGSRPVIRHSSAQQVNLRKTSSFRPTPHAIRNLNNSAGQSRRIGADPRHISVHLFPQLVSPLLLLLVSISVRAASFLAYNISWVNTCVRVRATCSKIRLPSSRDKSAGVRGGIFHNSNKHHPPPFHPLTPFTPLLLPNESRRFGSPPLPPHSFAARKKQDLRTFPSITIFLPRLCMYASPA